MKLYIVAITAGDTYMVPYSRKVHKTLSSAKRELNKANEEKIDRYKILYVDRWFEFTDKQ